MIIRESAEQFRSDSVAHKMLVEHGTLIILERDFGVTVHFAPYKSVNGPDLVLQEDNTWGDSQDSFTKEKFTPAKVFNTFKEAADDMKNWPDLPDLFSEKS